MSFQLHDVVWELTLRCNAVCLHCGSDAGRARPRELSTEEALKVCGEIADLGCDTVTFSGGEPLLREDWPLLSKKLVGRGVKVEVISNGLLIDEAMAGRCAQAGVRAVSMSIDGTEEIHDRLRGVPGSFRKAMAAAGFLRRAGLRVGAVTQVCRPNLPALAGIEDAILAAGFEGWQLQLTTPVGRATNAGLALDPEQIPEVVRFLMGPGKIPRYAADDIGWMSPDEPEIRSSKRPTDRVFTGCHAGLTLIGLTADGTVRGCLSMPPKFDEANVRDLPLAEIWSDPKRFAYNRGFDPASMTGFCADCPFKRVCRGGCKTLAFATQGGCLSENRYCVRARG
ncbi:MAG TPA: radical SAM protein [Myxococcales bacterium]|jgi:radical SAM protein with 4Fe4S-binding SPASM domain